MARIAVLLMTVAVAGSAAAQPAPATAPPPAGTVDPPPAAMAFEPALVATPTPPVQPTAEVMTAPAETVEEATAPASGDAPGSTKGPLTSLETEACRRLILDQVQGKKPDAVETAGATVGGVAGQAAGATVAGPLGAAVGGLVVGKMGQGVVTVAKKVLGQDDGKDAKTPAPGRPDPILLAECDARSPELRQMLTAKR